MPEIRILSDRVANQIAAGEVVERPMSVIKELLENAIDAGATRISIEFRNGGKSLMTIEDNGCGMARDQALLALERHATSKIRETADLDTIRSFGFRGEALPSISSVSRFSLRTRAADADCGTEIFVEGGKFRHCRDVGMPAGTHIEVSRLFFNVPARLKFLKSENTEAANITRCVRLYAVAHPEIAFTLRENGQEIFRSPAGTDLRERVAAIWGGQLAEDLIPLREKSREGMRISGLVGRPGVSRASRAEMVTIVNGRPVDNRTMAYSLVESYHTLIPRGRYPLAFLFLEIDPHAVDVNVHPAKREVRFRNESAVRNLVISAVLETVGGEESNAAIVEPTEKPKPRADFFFEKERVSHTGTQIAGTNAENPAGTRADAESVPVANKTPRPAENFSAPRNFVERATKKNADENPPRNDAPTPETRTWKNWRFIGRVGFDGLALFQVENALVVFNIRLALERIDYERVLRNFEQSAPVSQPLLIPEPIEFEPILADTLLRNLPTLARAGFAIEEFGRNFFRITETPDWFPPNEDVKVFLRDLVDRLARVPAKFTRGNIAHETLAKIAATRATRAENAVAETRDFREILSALFASSQPNVSPNGQKIFFEISRGELARRFL